MVWATYETVLQGVVVQAEGRDRLRGQRVAPHVKSMCRHVHLGQGDENATRLGLGSGMTKAKWL